MSLFLRYCALLCLLLAPGLAILGVDMSLSAGERFAVLALGLYLVALPFALVRRVHQGFWLALPWTPLIPIHLFLCWRYDSLPGDALVAAAMGTTLPEALAVAGSFGAWWLLLPLFMLVYLALLWRLPKDRMLSTRLRQWLLLGLLAYALLGLAARQLLQERNPMPPLFEERTAAMTFPLNWLLSAQRAWVHRQAMREAQGGDGRSLAPEQPLLLVLVIGETVRPDHLGLMGYARPTTPWMSSVRDQWLSYSDVASTAQWTLMAVPSIVTARHAGARLNLLQTFREAGFQTAWLSNQNREPYALAADLSDFPRRDVDFYYRQDTAMLPLAVSFVRQGRPRQLLVLHMHGSHYPYDLRYTREALRFRPTLSDQGVPSPPRPEHRAALINSYDNTLVALDQFMERLVGSLREQQRPVLLVFTSDHGENLFDDERQLFMHALPQATRHDLRVPLLLWANEHYRARWPRQWQALAMHRDKPVSHMALFPTLLEAAAVHWRGADPRQSLASPEFRPGPRPTLDGRGEFLRDFSQVR